MCRYYTTSFSSLFFLMLARLYIFYEGLALHLSNFFPFIRSFCLSASLIIPIKPKTPNEGKGYTIYHTYVPLFMANFKRFVHKKKVCQKGSFLCDERDNVWAERGSQTVHCTEEILIE